MDFLTGRPDQIEDYLITVRTGQWFGWSNSKNKIWTEENIKSKIKVLKGNEIYRVGDVKSLYPYIHTKTNRTIAKPRMRLSIFTHPNPVFLLTPME